MALTKIKGSGLSADALSEIRDNVASVPLSGLDVAGDISLGDNNRVYLGDGNDAAIWFDGNNLNILEGSGTGNLYIRGADLIFANSTLSETYAQMYSNGRVDLYFDNAVKFATTSTGVDVTGDIGADTATISGDLTVDTNTLYVDAASNRVGIGTITPGFKLQVIGASQIDLSAAGTQQALLLNNNDTTAGTQAVKLGFSSSSVTKASINAAVYGNDYMTFNVGSDTERVRITSTGNVGIGTSSPDYLFEAEASGGGEGASIAVTNTGPHPARLRLNSGHGNWSVSNSVSIADALEFRDESANSTRAIIDSSGNVGIGTSSPQKALNVVASSSSTTIGGSTAVVQVGNSSGAALNLTAGVELFGSGAPSSGLGNRSAGIYGVYEAFNAGGNAGALVLATNPAGTTSVAERMRITSTGSVGIGTSSPASKLSVSGSSGNSAVSFFGSAGSAISYMGSTAAGNYIIGAAANETFIRSDGVGIAFSANTGSSVQMRIDSSGNVGIGTSSPEAKLNVVSGDTLVAAINGTNANGGYMVWRQNGTVIADIGTSQQIFGTGGTDTFGINGRGARSVVFGTNNTERMRIGSNGFQRNNVALVVSSGQENTFYAGGDGVGLYNANAYSSCGAHIEVGSDATSGWSNIYCHKTWNTGEDTRQIAFYVNGSSVGSIDSTTSGTSYNTSSDYRLKENVVPLTNAADRLAQIPVHRFNFIVDPDKTVDGFLAHEVQAFVPEAVTGEKDAVDADGNPKYQGIDQSKLVPLLTAALQEALTRIETLEAEVAALKTT